MNKSISSKNKKIIMRILVARKEINMEEIKQYYLQTYGKEMNRFIS